GASLSYGIGAAGEAAGGAVLVEGSSCALASGAAAIRRPRAASAARRYDRITTRLDLRLKIPPATVVERDLSPSKGSAESEQRQDRLQHRADEQLWIGGRLHAGGGLLAGDAGLHRAAQRREVVDRLDRAQEAVVEVGVLVFGAAAEGCAVGPGRGEDHPVGPGQGRHV